jgi:hypothetical protein
MMADYIEVERSNNESVITQTARALVFFLIYASGKVASRPAGALSEGLVATFPL